MDPSNWFNCIWLFFNLGFPNFFQKFLGINIMSVLISSCMSNRTLLIWVLTNPFSFEWKDVHTYFLFIMLDCLYIFLLGFTPTFKMIHFETFFIFLYARHFCFCLWCRYPQKVHIIISFFLYRLCVLGVQLLIILSWAHNQQLLRRDQLFGFIDQLISNPLVFFVLVLTASFLSHACVYS